MGNDNSGMGQEIESTLRAPGNAVEWQPPPGGGAPPFLGADGALVWHAVPAFVTGGPVTVVRPTDPDFAESFRHFGVPAGHPARLERGLTAFVGPDWLVVFAGKSPIGVPRYRLQDAGRPAAASGAATFLVADDDRVRLETLDPGADADGRRSVWYIVPRAPDPTRGFDLVHAATGRRLLGPDRKLSPTLPPAPGPGDAWDLLRFGATAALHRPHFWLPLFLASPFGAERGRPAPAASDGRLVPIAAGCPPPGDGHSVPLAPVGDPEACLAAAADDPTAALVVLDAAGTHCRTYTAAELTAAGFDPAAGGTPAALAVDRAQAAEAGYAALNGSVLARQLERRLYADARPDRSTEFTAAWEPRPGGGGDRPARLRTLYVPRTAVAATDAAADGAANADAAHRYAHCLRAEGPDAPACADLLTRLADGSEDRRFAIQRAALAGEGGAPGVCAGPNLRTSACKRFCTDRRAGDARLCDAALRQLCADQTDPAAADPAMCPCWLPQAAYDAAQSAAFADLRAADAGLATRIEGVLRQQRVPTACWYAPCQASDVKPSDACPSQQILACVQVSQNNRFTMGGGDLNHEQVCNLSLTNTNTAPAPGLADTPVHAPAPAPAPAPGLADPPSVDDTPAPAPGLADADPSADTDADQQRRRRTVILTLLGAALALLVLMAAIAALIVRRRRST